MIYKFNNKEYSQVELHEFECSESVTGLFDGVYNSGKYIEPICEHLYITKELIESVASESEDYDSESIDYDNESDVEYVLNNCVFNEHEDYYKDFDDEEIKFNFLCKYDGSDCGNVYFKILMQYK